MRNVLPVASMRFRGDGAFLLIAIVLFAKLAQADDWPHWRGPERTGVSRESIRLQEGSSDGSKVLWRTAVGKGHSAVSVANGRAYTMGWDGSQDTVYCFDALTGRPVWKQSYPCRAILQWPGPRSTPTVSRGIVYTLGQHGQLRAWDALTGEPRWQRDLPEEYNPDVDYGFTSSPLMEGDLLILNSGSRGLAIRTSDGSIAWGDDRKKGACVSAVPFVHEGKRGVLIVHINDARSEANLVGVNPKSGEELWRWNGWKEQWGSLGVDPVVRDGKIFITSAQEYRQAARFTIVGKTLRQDWSTNRVAGYSGGAVLLDRHLYMVDSNGFLKCIDWNTGEEAWIERGFDERGSLIAAFGTLLIQTGSAGKLAIVAADPAGYRELGRITVFEEAPDTFTSPVLADSLIYCRSYAGEVACLQLD